MEPSLFAKFAYLKSEMSPFDTSNSSDMMPSACQIGDEAEEAMSVIGVALALEEGLILS
jgi:hypothetical protein